MRMLIASLKNLKNKQVCNILIIFCKKINILTTEQEELFRADLFIKLILEITGISTISLIGGAVTDIIEGSKFKRFLYYGEILFNNF